MCNYRFINGKKLYIEDFGKKRNVAVLYIHGKPGIGVIDFIGFQKCFFEKRYYVVAPEQRGVLRSECVEANEYNFIKIIDDYEKIRKEYGVEKWNIICHSFGAVYALLYYLYYSDKINSIVFESPILNMVESSKEILKYQLYQIDKFKSHRIQYYEERVQSIKSYMELGTVLHQVKEELGEISNDYMLYPTTLKKINFLKKDVEISNNFFCNSINTEKIFNSIIARYSYSINFEDITCPCLIMRGEEDKMIGGKEFDSFLKKLPNKNIITVPNSKHWIKIDNSSLYYEIIESFLTTYEGI